MTEKKHNNEIAILNEDEHVYMHRPPCSYYKSTVAVAGALVAIAISVFGYVYSCQVELSDKMALNEKDFSNFKTLVEVKLDYTSTELRKINEKLDRILESR